MRRVFDQHNITVICALWCRSSVNPVLRLGSQSCRAATPGLQTPRHCSARSGAAPRQCVASPRRRQPLRQRFVRPRRSDSRIMRRNSVSGSFLSPHAALRSLLRFWIRAQGSLQDLRIDCAAIAQMKATSPISPSASEMGIRTTSQFIFLAARDCVTRHCQVPKSPARGRTTSTQKGRRTLYTMPAATSAQARPRPQGL